MDTLDVQRRHFIRVAAAGALASCVTPSWPTRAEAVGFAGLISMVARFSVSVGSEVLANTVHSYLRRLSANAPIRQRVMEANQSLGGRGFSDTAQSRVYQTAVREETERLYYPLGYQDRCGCKHFVAPFFNVSCGCVPITHIEGPHMAGLTLAAELLQQHGWPQVSDGRGDDSIRSVLVPIEGRRLALGDKSRGYTTPLLYQSDNARVAIDYKPRDEHSGTVLVEATRRGGSSILNQEWDIRFA